MFLNTIIYVLQKCRSQLVGSTNVQLNITVSTYRDPLRLWHLLPSEQSVIKFNFPTAQPQK